MPNRQLLLLSSSREGNSDYLAHALAMIKAHLGSIDELLFIPYAGVSLGYDQYTEMVASALQELNIKVKGIHSFADPVAAVTQAQAIAVGGGNTFHLLYQLYQHKLIDVIRSQINLGIPYIGWSAGSNVAGKTIRTTNDMPIIEPPSFDALDLVPVQLNPHYTDFQAPGHNGETRAQRLAEFMVLNPQTEILAIVEGTALKVRGNKMTLIGGKDGYSFKNGQQTTIKANSDLSDRLL
jgi:dipeptidase E